MPAQSVVANSSKSAPMFFARCANTGVYAFFVSSGFGSSGPTPKRSFLLCAITGRSAAMLASPAVPINRLRREFMCTSINN